MLILCFVCFCCCAVPVSFCITYCVNSCIGYQHNHFGTLMRRFQHQVMCHLYVFSAASILNEQYVDTLGMHSV